MDQISSTQVLPFYGIERTAPSDIIFTNCSTNVHECFDNYRIREDGNWLLNFVDQFYQALLWICTTFFIKYPKYVNSFCALRSFFKIYFGTRHHYSCTIYPVHVHVLHKTKIINMDTSIMFISFLSLACIQNEDPF